MKIQPALEECKKLADEGNYGVIPVSTEIFSDASTPVEVLRVLKKVSAHVYLLESAEADKKWGRYSFLGYDPLLEITCYNGSTKIRNQLTTQTVTEDIRACIRNIIEENRSPGMESVGYVSFTGNLDTDDLDETGTESTRGSRTDVKCRRR